MTAFAGYRTITRHLFRLDRIKLPLWLLGLSFLVAVTPLSIRSVTEDEARRRGVTSEQVLAEQGAVVEANAAIVALSGPADSLDTFGGRYAFEIGAFSFAIVGLMNVLLVVRHTRSEEEAGRVELLRSAAVGPWARHAAVMTEAAVAAVVLTMVVIAAFALDGLALAASATFGAGFAICGLAFASTTLVISQIFEYGRGAAGASLGVLAFAYSIRAVGDVRDDWLVFLSPIGWSQAVDPFGASRLWPLAVSLTFTAAAAVAATALSRRRDVGRGLIEQRPGRAAARDRLLHPLGLAWRLQGTVLIWWTVGIAGFGAIYGSVLPALDDLIEDNEAMRDLLEDMGFGGDQLRAGFISMVLTMLAILSAAAGVQVVLRAATEEREGRAEMVLGTAISRGRWLGSYAVLALAAAPVMMAAAAIGMFGADALVAGEFVGTADGIRAAAVRIPAIWSLVGVTVLFHGWARRLSRAGWIAFGTSTVLFLFGDLLRLPALLVQLSPLPHVTHLPVDSQPWLPLAVLTACGVVGTAMGLGLIERRDVG